MAIAPAAEWVVLLPVGPELVLGPVAPLEQRLGAQHRAGWGRVEKLLVPAAQADRKQEVYQRCRFSGAVLFCPSACNVERDEQRHSY